MPPALRRAALACCLVWLAGCAPQAQRRPPPPAPQQVEEQRVEQRRTTSACARSDLDRVGMRELQTLLNLAGHAVGAVDGRCGRRTREAVAAWQSANGFRADGVPSRAVLARLREAAPAGMPVEPPTEPPSPVDEEEIEAPSSDEPRTGSGDDRM